jgi:hypothetical protein
MEPALRRNLSGAELATLTDAMATALRNVHLVAAVVGVIVLIIGSRLPRALNPTAPSTRRRV